MVKELFTIAQLIVAEQGFKPKHSVFRVCFIMILYCTKVVGWEFSPQVWVREKETKARTLEWKGSLEGDWVWPQYKPCGYNKSNARECQWPRKPNNRGKGARILATRVWAKQGSCDRYKADVTCEPAFISRKMPREWVLDSPSWTI